LTTKRHNATAYAKLLDVSFPEVPWFLKSSPRINRSALNATHLLAQRSAQMYEARQS
jgi:hypothetical protein